MFRIHLSTSAKAELARDISVFLTAFLATGVLDGNLTRDALVAAAVAAAKVTARSLFPHPEA